MHKKLIDLCEILQTWWTSWDSLTGCYEGYRHRCTYKQKNEAFNKDNIVAMSLNLFYHRIDRNIMQQQIQ